MRFLIVNTDYSAFLADLYAGNPGLSSRSYREQLQTRLDTLFGMADFYSSNLRKLGHEAYDIYANNRHLQLAWAREHGLQIRMKKRWRFHLRRGVVPWVSRCDADGWMFDILEAQLRHYQPDVVLNQAPVEIPPDFWRRVKPYAGFLAGQISWIHLTNGNPERWRLAIPENQDWNVYDLVISSFPPTVDWFRARGVNSQLNRLAFEPRVLERLNASGKKFDVTFVGSCFSLHSSRRDWLEQLCRKHDINVWMPERNRGRSSASIRRAYSGQAWGLNMYQAIRDSKITLNHHGNVPPFANNMRLYEATGVGTLLITDAKQDLSDLFTPGSEVVAYRDTEECAELIAYYLRHEDERNRIGASGQARTLHQHTYQQRMVELESLIAKYK